MKLLCLSTIDWNFLWQRHHIFMKQFAEAGWEIYFIENTGFRNPSWRDLRRLVRGVKERLNMGAKSASRTVNPVPANLQVISPWVLPPNGTIFRWLNRVFFVPRLMRQLRQRGLDQPDLGFVYLPTVTTLQILEQAKPRTIVYDCVANFAGHPQVPRDFSRTERHLLEKAALVLTDSDYLYRLMLQKHPRVEQLHQGVDVGLFDKKTDGEDFGHAQYRTVCFYGAIDDRMDWEAVQALRRAGAEVTLIGSAKVPVPAGIEVRGPFGYAELAEEVQQYDVLLLPYLQNRFTDGIIPAKIFECLATGKPVLTSALPSLERLGEVLYRCDTPEDYVRAFKELAETETEDLRRRRCRIAQSQSAQGNFLRLQEMLSKAMDL